jgi:hypothetical protein
MDQLLQMLQSTDPSDNQPDLPELLHLEGNLIFCLPYKQRINEVFLVLLLQDGL